MSPKFTRLVMRAFTFAPRFTSFLTSSRLVILPDPCGAGSLSPTPGLRTIVIMCRARITRSDGIRIGARVQQICRKLDNEHSSTARCSALVPGGGAAAARLALRPDVWAGWSR